MKELVEDLKIANDNLYSANKMLEKENKRLHSIIKEVREYIEDTEQDGYKLVWLHLNNTYFEASIKEILDKEK